MRARAKSLRNAQLCEDYKRGMSSVALAEKYGISRERACQVLRTKNLISLKQERDRIAREEIIEEITELRAELHRERRRKIDKAVALIRGGMSINQALREVDASDMRNHPEFRGLSAYGRHRDFSARKKRFAELRATGLTVKGIIAVMRGEGERINSTWIAQHIAPDLRGDMRRKNILEWAQMAGRRKA